VVHATQNTLSDVLERARRDPYTLLGQASLGCLHVFIGGYECGCAHSGCRSGIDPRLGRFSEWVAEKLGRGNLSVSGWCMISVECADEARALQRYFELWDEYTTVVEPVAVPDPPPPPAPLRTWNLRELLADVRRRPAMYLGHSSVTLLQAFIRGYATALEYAGRSTDELSDLEGFSHWLSARRGLRKPYRWDRVLLLFHSEAGALEEFFKALDEYEGGNHSKS
jgi:hypothetical protein